jgi:DNA-directed RNA polymerase alpha subunit
MTTLKFCDFYRPDGQTDNQRLVVVTDSPSLRIRTKNILRNLGVTTIDQMAALTVPQILQAQNAGEETLPDIMIFLAKSGKRLSA